MRGLLNGLCERQRRHGGTRRARLIRCGVCASRSRARRRSRFAPPNAGGRSPGCRLPSIARKGTRDGWPGGAGRSRAATCGVSAPRHGTAPSALRHAGTGQWPREQAAVCAALVLRFGYARAATNGIAGGVPRRRSLSFRATRPSQRVCRHPWPSYASLLTPPQRTRNLPRRPHPRSRRTSPPADMGTTAA